MILEREFFQRLRAQEAKLLPYGFKKTKQGYTLKRPLLDGQFRAEITITPSLNLEGKVIDMDTKEEYSLIYQERIGTFTAKVRSAYLELLEDIAKHCFVEVPFISDQANRLATYCAKTHHSVVEAPFKKEETGKVFRNPHNKKWYGLIMHVDRKKVDPTTKENEEVEILNLKADTNQIPELTKIDGIYPSYHMNKKHWISIVLDETVDDSIIESLLDQSFQYTSFSNPNLSNSVWLTPANPKYFDVLGAFQQTPTLDWHSKKKMYEGDTVYIYFAAPISAILIKCIVEAVHPSNVITLNAIKFYPQEQYPYETLKKKGLKTVRFTTHLPQSVVAYIEEKDN
ncbi:MAG: MmcQ/YjbR family DNA-binding protein [Solobacterium sp.]|nr:MmcQ/YjbR family DNA-binding protein [Solobacterium sp.]